MTLTIDRLWLLKARMLDAAAMSPARLLAPSSTPWWAWPSGLLLTVGFTLAVTLLAVLVCAIVDPTADCAGSGLPLIKYILSGEVAEEAEEHLTKRTMLAKALGLVLAAGAGLSIGREGPNIHMCVHRLVD